MLLLLGTSAAVGELQARVAQVQPSGGLCFVRDHGEHRNAKRYNSGCDMFWGAKQHLHTKQYRLAKNDLLRNVIAQTKYKPSLLW